MHSFDCELVQRAGMPAAKTPIACRTNSDLCTGISLSNVPVVLSTAELFALSEALPVCRISVAGADGKGSRDVGRDSGAATVLPEQRLDIHFDRPVLVDEAMAAPLHARSALSVAFSVDRFNGECRRLAGLDAASISGEIDAFIASFEERERRLETLRRANKLADADGFVLVTNGAKPMDGALLGAKKPAVGMYSFEKGAKRQRQRRPQRARRAE